MKFFSITALRNDVEKYLKKDVYSNCKMDLCNLFIGKNIQEISSLPRLILPAPNFYYIKSRVQNSNLNKGKRGCYRLYFYVDTKSECIYLIGFYPKTGTYGREDLTRTEEKIMIEAFVNERENGTLVEHDIDSGFAEVESAPLETPPAKAKSKKS